MIGTKEQIIKKLEKASENDLFELKKKNKDSYRSYQQVKYYWGVVVPIIGNFHGLYSIEVNEMLKGLFIKETFTDLSPKEFEDIMDVIRQLWKNKYDVHIPLPNESEEMEYRDKNL